MRGSKATPSRPRAALRMRSLQPCLVLRAEPVELWTSLLFFCSRQCVIAVGAPPCVMDTSTPNTSAAEPGPSCIPGKPFSSPYRCCLLTAAAVKSPLLCRSTALVALVCAAARFNWCRRTLSPSRRCLRRCAYQVVPLAPCRIPHSPELAISQCCSIALPVRGIQHCGLRRRACVSP